MDQLHLLLLLSTSMLIGSFLSGIVPMAFKLSDSKSRLLALMGSGILVGTALAIIIPEGIDSIYSNQISDLSPAPVPVTPMSAINKQPSVISDHVHPNITSNQIVAREPVQLWIIGVSLVAGFVLMLLIDQFSLYQAGVGNTDHHYARDQDTPQPNRHEYSLANQDEDEEDEDILYDKASKISDEVTSETKPIKLDSVHNSNNTFKVSMRDLDGSDKERVSSARHINRTTPTLGLVIHASADGIALGAAATTSHRDVEMIIFLAIMLHKAPAAFSLVVFLLHRGLKHSTIRRHLLAFSLSAPLAALVTYFGLSQSGKEALRRNNATGIAMLFSAGTFLYVATVHVLPELVHNKLLSLKEMVFLIGGAFLPILLAQMI